MKAFLIALLGLTIIASACKHQDGESREKDLEGKVVAIADGDTFTLLTKDKRQEKIRLHGIDCPEKKQPFGTVAKRKLSELIFGQNVSVKFMSRDRYKRIVGIVYQDGLNVNELMIKEGFAWHFKRYDDNPKWAEMEMSAKNKKLGIWKDSNAIAPWEWRTGH